MRFTGFAVGKKVPLFMWPVVPVDWKTVLRSFSYGQNLMEAELANMAMKRMVDFGAHP